MINSFKVKKQKKKPQPIEPPSQDQSKNTTVIYSSKNDKSFGDYCEEKYHINGKPPGRQVSQEDWDEFRTQRKQQPFLTNLPDEKILPNNNHVHLTGVVNNANLVRLKKTELRAYIQNVINETKTIRQQAEFNAHKTCGQSEIWQKVDTNRQYFANEDRTAGLNEVTLWNEQITDLRGIYNSINKPITPQSNTFIPFNNWTKRQLGSSLTQKHKMPNGYSRNATSQATRRTNRLLYQIQSVSPRKFQATKIGKDFNVNNSLEYFMRKIKQK